jgi:hypothetical protein
MRNGPEALQTIAVGAILGGTDGIADAFDDVQCVAGKMKTSFLTLEAQWLGEANLLGLAMELWSAEIESTPSGARIWLLWFEPVAAIQGAKELEK